LAAAKGWWVQTGFHNSAIAAATPGKTGLMRADVSGKSLREQEAMLSEEHLDAALDGLTN